MAKKIKRRLLLFWSRILALSISLLGAFICTNVAVGAQRQEVEAAPADDNANTSYNDNVPAKINTVRVGSANMQNFRNKIKNETAVDETNTPPSPPAAQSTPQASSTSSNAATNDSEKSQKVKESKDVEKSEIKIVYGIIENVNPGKGLEKKSLNNVEPRKSLNKK